MSTTGAINGAGPSGQLWDVYLTSLAINGAMQRMLVLPPGAPQAALNELRAAVLKPQQRYGVRGGGAQGRWASFRNTSRARRPTGRCVQALAVKPEIRAFVANYIKSANK